MSKDEHSESGESSELARSEEVHVLPKNNLWLCLPALLLVTFLGSLDSTIVSVSLNTISKDLNSSSQSAYSWVGTIYLLTCTVVGPVTGKMTDIMGMKPMLYSGIALFVLSSGLCGASNRGLVNSLVGLVHSLSNAIGPLIGGAIAEHTSWSWCFWINLPTSAIAFTMLFFFLNVSQPPHASFKEKFNSFDYLGLILIACMTLKQTNTSTSSFTFVRDLAGTMGISLGGVIMHTEAVKRLSKIDGGQRFADMSEIASLKEADISENLRMSVQQAYSKAISTNYIFTSCVIAVGFLASLSIKKYTLDVKNIKEGEEEEDGEEKGDGNKKGFRKEEDEGKGEIHLPATTASSDTTLVKTKDMENQKPKQHL
ncbi:hypothetical protein J056_002853 [Wallemia ichthyophaga EXF-994]|uniref:Major facilitator superfamily (MFS) profile domain-containing protein n=1 Tax=Wallemia ichthyophaga (strain EXF-994 / CBS 113033) TaxID=1299270 RepID=R9A957_WALI9|nr:uncharacterized protein J056_002853 [Wallemia ichthyophaga EXF-994]EOQ98743.1 hypothetical protein J056_002853 [Wallemia ichthyophaga EXF-994]